MPRTRADDEMIARVIQREGGFVDHPLDRGGPTNMGLTLTTLTLYVKRKTTVDELKALRKEVAERVYYDIFIERPGIDQIDSDAVREFVFDEAVNSGPTMAIKHFQRAIGVKDDGVIGPVTIARWHTLVPLNVLFKVCAQRLRFYGEIVSGHPEQRVFLVGWINRIAGLMEELVS